MAHYAEFGYYRDEYEGGIEKEADFKKCRRIAESYIDQYTLNRITDPETVPGLKDCTCEMTEAVFDVCYKDDGQVKKSETTDGYSVTYVTEVSDGTDWTALLGQNMYQICRRYLLHTGLLSRSLKC